MTISRRLVALLILGAMCQAAAGSAVAGTAVRSVGPAAVSATAGVHRYFGSLMSARGPMLTLRLRNGALLRVDATEAFASGSVSAPLFAGKSTVVKGTFSTPGIFHATSVQRATQRVTNWGSDR